MSRAGTFGDTPGTPVFEWSARAEQAAVLVADDKLSDAQIAAAVGVNRRTLTRWRAVAEFQARVAGLVEGYRKATAALSISDKQHRISALEDRWQRMRQVIDARAVDATMQDVPGGPTGLLVRSYKSAGGVLMEEYAVDTGLLKEIRAHEQQAAQELGQWTDKSEISGQGAGTVIILPATNGGGIQP